MWKLTKAILWLAIGIFCINFVSAIDICSRENPIRTNCTMLTPALNCTEVGYNYSIVNISGAIIVNSTLTNLALDIYYLNFSQPKGNYIVRLCDGSTREVRVVEGDDNDMIVGALILIPMLLAMILIYAANSFSEEYKPMKIALFIFAMFPFIVSLHFGLVAIIKFYDWPEMQALIGTTTYWYTLVISVFIMVFLLYILVTAIQIIAGKKQTDMEY